MSESAKREIIAADSETDPAKFGRVPKPFIWGWYNGSEYHEFHTKEAFLQSLETREAICYAHNGGKFDWHYLIPDIQAHSDIMVIAGRLAKFKIGQCEFRDSFNIMPMPLRAGGQKFEIDLSILESTQRDIPANRELIRERLRTDCLYLYDMLDKFHAEFGRHLTISSASMSAWSKISGIAKPETSAEFYATLAPYYFGGRVEVFAPGVHERQFKVIDKNSAYPHAMLSLHPWGTIIHENDKLPVTDAYTSRCFISLSAGSTGAFPFRGDDGALTFPADGERRDFHITGWEYLCARDTGTLQGARVTRVLSLPESIEFTSYMDHFYRMKSDAKAAKDAARYEFAKRFLCSLYGKFGSNPDNYYEYTFVEPRHIEAACELDGYDFVAELGPWALMQRPMRAERKRFYNVATAASITGYVRADLWKSLRDVALPLYCDTDSIACCDTGNLRLHDSELGAWKVENVCDFGAFAGRKLYAVRTLDGKYKTASKGVRLSAQEIIRIAEGDEIDYEPEFPMYSIKQGIRFQKRTIRRTAHFAS